MYFVLSVIFRCAWSLPILDGASSAAVFQSHVPVVRSPQLPSPTALPRGTAQWAGVTTRDSAFAAQQVSIFTWERENRSLARIDNVHTCPFVFQTGDPNDCWYQCYPSAPPEADGSGAPRLQHCVSQSPPHRIIWPVWNWDTSAAQHVHHFPLTDWQPASHAGTEKDHRIQMWLMVWNVQNMISPLQRSGPADAEFPQRSQESVSSTTHGTAPPVDATFTAVSLEPERRAVSLPQTPQPLNKSSVQKPKLCGVPHCPSLPGDLDITSIPAGMQKHLSDPVLPVSPRCSGGASERWRETGSRTSSGVSYHV